MNKSHWPSIQRHFAKRHWFCDKIGVKARPSLRKRFSVNVPPIIERVSILLRSTSILLQSRVLIDFDGSMFANG